MLFSELMGLFLLNTLLQNTSLDEEGQFSFPIVTPVMLGCVQYVPHQIDTHKVNLTTDIISNCVETDDSVKTIFNIHIKKRMERGCYTLSSDDLGHVHTVVSLYMQIY